MTKKKDNPEDSIPRLGREMAKPLVASKDLSGRKGGNVSQDRDN